MTSARAALERLVAASGRVAHAQLAARGCAPVAAADSDPVADSPERPDLWLAGPRHATAVVAAAADPAVSAGLAGLDPDLVSAVTELASPAEVLAALGGDDRQVPVDGRNAYGLPLYDLAPHIRLSSCTATPPDRLTLRTIDEWRRRMLEKVLSAAAPPSPADLHQAVAVRLCRRLGLVEGADRVILAPSGTHIESIVTALAAGGTTRPLLNIMVGTRETGAGSALAAAGRAFHIRSPFQLASQPGSLLAGFDYDVRVVDVDVRDATGRPRRAFDVEAEIEAHLELGLDEGARVLVHVLDGSKTGLHQPPLAWVRHWRAAHPDRLRVVVDGAQARIPASRVRSYLAAGASVSLTGSKGLGGPPFCGALLLDDGLLADAESISRLPDGFGTFLSRMELPPSMARLAAGLPAAANYGLASRWHAALSEWESSLLIPSHLRAAVTTALLDQLATSLPEIPGVEVLGDPVATRSIVTLRISDGDDGFLAGESLRRVYRDMVHRPGVQVGQPVELVPNRLAALRFAVGVPTVTRLLAADRPIAAARAMATDAVELLSETLRDPVSV